MLEQLQKKYPFFSMLEIKTLYLISKCNLDYDLIKDLNSDSLTIYIEKYVNETVRINKDTNQVYDTVVSNLDVNIMFLLKKNNISIDKIYNILKKLENKNVSNYPSYEFILYKINKDMYYKKMCNYFVILISFICIGYSLIIVTDFQKENKKMQSNVNNINKITSVVEKVPEKEEVTVVSDDYFKYLDVSMIDVDIKSLKKENSDVVGWIKVNGTNVNYPFVQTKDNEFYLKHSFDKTYNKKGWVFLDYRNNINKLDDNTIIYAHGLVNNAMFGSLRNVYKSSWYENKDNHIIKTSTQNKNMLWKVFSSYKIEPESYYLNTNFEDKKEYLSFLLELEKRSLYDYNVTLTENDKIITLSTCYDDTKRGVIHAKLIAVTEK